MRNEALYRQNVATIAGPHNENAKSGAADEPECGSAQIRRTAELLRELLLRDQYAPDRILSCQVRESLEEMQQDLVELVGLQLMFELWIGGQGK